LDTRFGKFTLLDVKIDTGRTHQIRVHMAAMGHPVVGDTLYGAPREMRGKSNALPIGKTQGKPSRNQSERDDAAANPGAIGLPRNFLHAAVLEFRHPRTGDAVALKSELPEELQEFLKTLEE
jgi:23S rRNA pseudouridine1911/1915/1917 synthase